MLILEGYKENFEKHYKNKLSFGDFEKIVKADPTSIITDTQDKMGKYSKWLLDLFIKKDFRLDDLNKIKTDLSLFDKYRSKLDIKDINKIKSHRDLYELVKSYHESDNVPVSNKEKEREIKKEAKKFHEDSTWLVIIPETHDAACYYGKGTRWCTAGKDDPYTFDRYNDDGNLYVFINKHDRDDAGRQIKYQMHIQTGQFMDVKDNAVDIRDIIDFGLFCKCVINEGLQNQIATENDVENLSKSKDTQVEFIEAHYPIEHNERLEMSRDNIIKYLNGNIGYDDIGLYKDEIIVNSIRDYISEDELMVNALRKAIKDDLQAEDMVDVNAIDIDELADFITEHEYLNDLIGDTLADLYFDLASDVLIKDFNHYFDRYISKFTDVYSLTLVKTGFDLGEFSRGDLMDKPYYGFDDTPSQSDYKEAFYKEFDIQIGESMKIYKNKMKKNNSKIRESRTVMSNFRTDFKQNMGITIEDNKYMGVIRYMVNPDKNEVIYSYNIPVATLNKEFNLNLPANVEEVTVALSRDTYEGNQPTSVAECYNICKANLLDLISFNYTEDIIQHMINNYRGNVSIIGKYDNKLKTTAVGGATVNSNESLSAASNFKPDFEEEIEINYEGQYIKALIQYQVFDDYVAWFLNIPNDTLIDLFGQVMHKIKDINLAHGEVKYNGGPLPTSADDAYEYCFHEIDNAVMKKYTEDDLTTASYTGAMPAWLRNMPNDVYEPMATESLVTSFELFENYLNENKTKFTSKERKKLSDKGEAMKDGSFPIRNGQDLKDAIRSYGRAKNKAAAKSWIKKRAKELGKMELLPEDWKK